MNRHIIFFLFIVILMPAHMASATAVSPQTPTTFEKPVQAMKTTAPAPQLKPKEDIDKLSPTAPVTKKESDTYYSQCVGNALTLQGLNPFQRDYLCSCVAAGLPLSMNSNELKDAQTRPGTAIGRDGVNKFLTTVYFPCALQPLQEMLWSDCVNRARGNLQFAGNAKKHCQCYMGRMMRYTQTLGIAETEHDITRWGRFNEPFDILTNATGFSEERVKSFVACFDGMMP